jgi:hypothetical protein
MASYSLPTLGSAITNSRKTRVRRWCQEVHTHLILIRKKSEFRISQQAPSITALDCVALSRSTPNRTISFFQ